MRHRCVDFVIVTSIKRRTQNAAKQKETERRTQGNVNAKKEVTTPFNLSRNVLVVWGLGCCGEWSQKEKAVLVTPCDRPSLESPVSQWIPLMVDDIGT